MTAQPAVLPGNLLIKNMTLSIPNTQAEVRHPDSPVMEMKAVKLKNGKQVPIKAMHTARAKPHRWRWSSSATTRR